MPTPDKLHLIVSAELTPRGDGTYILKPGKPTRWLWTAEAGRLYGVSPDTIVRWWRSGYIVGERIGPRRIRIDSDSLACYVKGPPKPEAPPSFQAFGP